MAQINKANEYFNTVLYTGNGTSQSITGVNFQPDLVWLKSRSVTNDHTWGDTVRGIDNSIFSNRTVVERYQDSGGYISSSNSDGFTVQAGSFDASNVNVSGETYVAWNWLAGGTAVSNTDGSITSTVSANTTSGFSVVSYTGTGSGGATVGHGLGVAPKAVIVKSRGSAQNWFVNYPFGTGNGYIMLNQTDAGDGANSTVWNSTAPTSSVVTLGTSVGVNDTTNYIMYCFAEKKGFSKFGSYTGNGSTDGTFVYTGFKPAFLILKRTDSVADWFLHDNKRNGFNPDNDYLQPNLNSAETNFDGLLDFVSNGFKLKTTSTAYNASGGTYIYMAFAENPLVGTNNVPACAR